MHLVVKYYIIYCWTHCFKEYPVIPYNILRVFCQRAQGVKDLIFLKCKPVNKTKSVYGNLAVMQFFRMPFCAKSLCYSLNLVMVCPGNIVQLFCIWFACVVACVAVFPGIKGNFAVMADTALFTLHDKVIRKSISALFHYKYILMTDLALEPYPMKPVRENNRRKVFCLQTNSMVFHNYIA